MKNKIISIILIIVGIVVLLLLRTNYSDYNFKRTVEACMVAQKKLTKQYNSKESREYCEKEIKKSFKSSK